MKWSIANYDSYKKNVIWLFLPLVVFRWWQTGKQKSNPTFTPLLFIFISISRYLMQEFHIRKKIPHTFASSYSQRNYRITFKSNIIHTLLSVSLNLFCRWRPWELEVLEVQQKYLLLFSHTDLRKLPLQVRPWSLFTTLM